MTTIDTRDHAARLRLIRAGRQLGRLIDTLTAECRIACGDLPPIERADMAARYDAVHHAVTAYLLGADRLIDGSSVLAALESDIDAHLAGSAQ